MPSVKFIEHNGTEHVVEGNNGDSLMVIATSNLVPGIDADCGGECSCATCHVLVDGDWLSKLGAISETEESMLDLQLSVLDGPLPEGLHLLLVELRCTSKRYFSRTCLQRKPSMNQIKPKVVRLECRCKQQHPEFLHCNQWTLYLQLLDHNFLFLYN